MDSLISPPILNCILALAESSEFVFFYMWYLICPFYFIDWVECQLVHILAEIRYYWYTLWKMATSNWHNWLDWSLEWMYSEHTLHILTAVYKFISNEVNVSAIDETTAQLKQFMNKINRLRWQLWMCSNFSLPIPRALVHLHYSGLTLDCAPLRHKNKKPNHFNRLLFFRSVVICNVCMCACVWIDRISLSLQLKTSISIEFGVHVHI